MGRGTERRATRLLDDRYQLGEVLGHGGMFEVHRGLDTRLDRDVAVKVLRADLARHPEVRMRFLREARNTSALSQHPAIVAVHDTGDVESEYGPRPYIVMEYVDGQTLREIVSAEGPMSMRQVTEVMADVCAALDFGHRHNIIHGGVRPANIMLNRGGAVKVADFGITRAFGEGQNVTATPAVLDTARYLSPEQVRGEPVDVRSDVYAAGCVLFELFTGEPPFTGDTPMAVADQHLRADPRAPSEVNPQLATALDPVVLRALSKNPADRYQSAAEMRADLVRVRVRLMKREVGPSEAPVVPQNAPPKTLVIPKNAAVLSLAPARRRDEDHGDEVYVFNNSGSTSTSREQIRVAHTARVELVVDAGKTKAIDGTGKVTFLNLASVEGKIKQEVLSKYSLALKTELVFEQTTSIDIPARTHVRVAFRWKRVWEEGTVTLGDRGRPLARVPYAVTIGVRFDKETQDV